MEVLKVGVFYDGNYFLHVSNYYSYYSEVRRRLSLPGFHRFLCHAVAQAEGVSDVSCRVVTGHYFRGRLSAQDASHRCRQLYNDRVFDDVLMSVGVETHYLPLRTRMGRKEEKGIDVWLALEAYERSMQYGLDVVVLVSSDGEYVPLIRKLSTLGVRVMVLNWEFDYSDETGRQVSTRSSSDLLAEVSYALDVDNLIREGLAAGDPIVEGLFMPESNEETPYDDEDDFPFDGQNDAENEEANGADGKSFARADTLGSLWGGRDPYAADEWTSGYERHPIDMGGSEEGGGGNGSSAARLQGKTPVAPGGQGATDIGHSLDAPLRSYLEEAYARSAADREAARKGIYSSGSDAGQATPSQAGAAGKLSQVGPMGLSATDQLHEAGACENGAGAAEVLALPRYRSRIINLISDKGYGFIEYCPANLFFYHRDLINVAIGDLRVGDEVEFSIGQGRNGNEVAAKQIKLVDERE